MLIIKRPMRIDVRVEKPQLLCTKVYRYAHRQTRPPGAIMPRQINPSNLFERQTTEQGNARVAGVLQRDLLFEVQPPLALLWLNSTRNSRADINVGQAQSFGKSGRDMLPARAPCLFVSLLQC